MGLPFSETQAGPQSRSQARSLLTPRPIFIMMTRYFSENSAACISPPHNCLWFLYSGTVQRRLPPKAPISEGHGLTSGSSGFIVIFFADCCLIVYSGVIRRARIAMCTRRVWLPDLARPHVQPLYSGRRTGKSWLPESPPVCGVHPSEWYVLVHAFWRQGLCFC